MMKTIRVKSLTGQSNYQNKKIIHGGIEMYNEDFQTEDEIWDEVVSDWFPNAGPDEIEDELESWFKD